MALIPFATAPVPIAPSNSVWQPPQWSKPAMVSITVPETRNFQGIVDGQTVGFNPTVDQFTLKQSATLRISTTYVFDAVLALEHEQSITKTRHPVQTGASISSHAYIEPAHIVLEVLMSDVVGQFTSTSARITPWTGNPSKSVSAYQQMLTLQAQRLPLTIVTRLNTYSNMLIMRVAPREDHKTITGARFRIEFEQLFIADTQTTPVSLRPNSTNNTSLGTVNPSTPSLATVKQFQTPLSTPPPSVAKPVPTSPRTIVPVNVPGAGGFSSNNVNTLDNLFF